jgi:hypothetical protein
LKIDRSWFIVVLEHFEDGAGMRAGRSVAASTQPMRIVPSHSSVSPRLRLLRDYQRGPASRFEPGSNNSSSSSRAGAR